MKIFTPILIIILFLTNAKYVSLSVMNSLKFCYSNLIPSLFPFMVLSFTLMNSINICINSKTLKLILDNCIIYSNEIIFGCFCGFVVGAKGICKKFKNGHDINDFNRGIFLSSNAGIGFVIGCIGCILYEDIIFGFYLYIIQILCGIVLFKLTQNKKESTVYFERELRKNGIIDTFVKSVKTSIDTIITVCGFSLFFSVIYDLITLNFILKNNTYYSLVQTVLDFSKGAFLIVKIDNFTVKSFLIGFCVGFGGICAYMQICAECENYPFKKLRFLIFKLIQGIMCGTLSLIYLKFFGNT